MRLSFFCLLLVLQTTRVAHAEEYVVGTGAYQDLADVPWSELGAGDIVTIPYRAEPYRETFAITTSGSSTSPITVRGTRGPQGQRPVIDGENAVQGEDTHVRSLISLRDGASYIVIEGLEVVHGHNDYAHAGLFPSANASGIYVEDAAHVTIRDCELHGNGNGLFSAPGTVDLHIERNYVWGNGNDGSTQEHNSYTETDGIVFEGNRYGPLCTGCLGNNLKDRSAGTIVRYNFIEGGNRTLDLVEAETSDQDFTNRVASAPVYVYGNVLVKRDDTSQAQVVHFGGDSGDSENYRRTLRFYNNTVYSTRTARTVFFHFDADAPSVDVRSSIFVASSGEIFLLDSSTTTDSVVALSHLYMPPSWEVSVETALEDAVTSTDLTLGTTPGFVNAAMLDFHLTPAATARDQGIAPASGAPPVLREYVAHLMTKARDDDGPIDLGAFEVCESGCVPVTAPDGGVGGPDGGGGDPDGAGGCGCHAAAKGSSMSFAILGVIAITAARRRRRPL